MPSPIHAQNHGEVCQKTPEEMINFPLVFFPEIQAFSPSLPFSLRFAGQCSTKRRLTAIELRKVGRVSEKRKVGAVQSSARRRVKREERRARSDAPYECLLRGHAAGSGRDFALRRPRTSRRTVSLPLKPLLLPVRVNSRSSCLSPFFLRSPDAQLARTSRGPTSPARARRRHAASGSTGKIIRQ